MSGFSYQFSHAPIDIHSHFNHGSPFDWPLPDNPLHLRELDFVLEEQRNVGIECGGFSTFASVLEHPECIVEENEYLYQLASEDPRIFLFGTDTYACSFQLGRVALARLTHADKENILYKNAMKMFPEALGEL